jgi:predicted nucleic acid-binding protein
MITYVLDTDIISYLWDVNSPYHQRIVDKLNSLNDDDIVGLSIVSIYELTYGVNSFKDENLKSTFQNALTMIKKDKDIFIYSLDVKSADFFSEIKQLYKSNTGISSKSAKKNDLDFMIASVVMSQKAILVSNDKLFETLSNHTNLKYENWTS